MVQLPEWFEEALGACAGVRLESPKALEAVAPAVEYLSKRFMRQEDSVPERYFSDPAVRRAYLAYFFTTNVLKLAPVLDELALSGFFNGRESLRAMDIGAGVGTAGAGLLTWLAERAQVASLELLAADRSNDACAEARRTMACFERFIRIPSLIFSSLAEPIERLNALETKAFDLIIAQNVLVESPLYAEMLAFARRALAPDGALVLIEPASRHGSRTLLTFRDMLVQAGFTIYAPCVRQAECPALARQKDWCHAVSRWKRPSFIRVLDGYVGNLRLALKYSYVVARVGGGNIGDAFAQDCAGELFRVVSERMDEKGRRKFFGCGGRGRILFEKQKRDTADGNRAFDAVERYDIIAIEGTLPVANAERVRSDGNVRIVKKFD